MMLAMKQRILLAMLWLTLVSCSAGPLVASPNPSHELGVMAEVGRFDDVLTRLKEADLASTDEQAAQLVHWLERYNEHVAHYASRKLQTHEEALKKMAESVEADKLDEAIVYAVEAHATATDPEQFLEGEQIRELVSSVETRAIEDESEGQWLEAMSLYRRLNLLFDPREPYRSQVKRLEQQVRVLRIYAPETLNQMFLEAAKKNGNEDAKPPIMDDQTTWQQRLEGVRSSMMYETYRHVVDNHVDSVGYKQLLLGAIDRLSIMVQTRGMETAFATLGDKEIVERFTRRLTDIRLRCTRVNRDLSSFDASKRIEDILTSNRMTVNLPEAVMVYELTEGAVSTLDDFTAVIWPYDLQQFERNTQGVFYGVGIQIATTDNRLTVVSPLPGTPAHRAGVRSGDIITKVDDKDTSHWTLDWAVREITGPEGTKVKLTIERKTETDPLEFVLTRSRIKIESVQGWKRDESSTTGWDFYIDHDDHIGYVRISQFIPQTTDDLDDAINQMQKQGGINALVLDLRFNPGGLLKQSVDMVDRFVREGTIVSTVRVDGEVTSSFSAHIHRTHPTLPMTILVNQGSASASEIVSGALQDHQKAVVVGTRSFGKGSVQDIVQLSGGRSVLKLTTQHYQLPLGRKIHRNPDADQWGIEPDMVVEMTDQHVADAIEFRRQADILHTPDEPVDPDQPWPDVNELLEKGTDLQLEAAVLILKTKLLAASEHMARRQTANSTTK